MMILNLINTIAIAIGISTSVNNTNFNSERKQQKRSVETINIQETFNLMQSYQYDSYNSQYNISSTKEAKKYFISNTANPNYTNNYMNIYNSTYCITSYDRINANGLLRVVNETYMFLSISNYYDDYVSFSLQTEQNVLISSTTYIQNEKHYDTSSILNQYVNLTLTNTIADDLYNFVTTYANDSIYNYGFNGTATEGTYQAESSTVQINLAPRENKYIMIFIQNIWANQSNTWREGDVTPSKFTITGSVLVPDNPEMYEVIDIPGLMFTVLSLPFSFISQAFNLTIFPNTPYALNFTNLFMTIIAVFILLWLIKKILK